LCGGRRSIAEVFRIEVISNSDVRSPILTLGSTSFFHVRHENLYIVALTKWNANAALVFEFCYRIINLGRSYFGKLDEVAVKENFVLIYELLDGKDTPCTIRTPFVWLYRLSFWSSLTSKYMFCCPQRYSTLDTPKTVRRTR